MYTNSSLECRQVLYIACTKQALNTVHVLDKDNAILSCTPQYYPYLYCALIYFVGQKKETFFGCVLSGKCTEAPLFQCCTKTQNKFIETMR